MLFFTDSKGTVCFDKGCRVTLVDRNWLAKKLLSQKISTILAFLKIRDIGTSKHKSVDFNIIMVYIPGIDGKGHEVYTSITYKLYLVDRLKANILVRNDILFT